MNKSRTESEIESNFITRLAQMNEADIDEIIADLPDAGETDTDKDKIDPSLGDDSEENLPDMDSDMEEAQAVKDLIPWDSFVIIFDPHYAQVLTETLGLSEPKAKAKSFYIYFAPENKRLEGILNKRYVGGYDEKEKLGEDFEFIKSLSPEGFPSEWKQKILTNIDEAPAVENQDIKEELDKKEEPEEEVSEVIEEKDVEEPKKEKKEEVPPPEPVGKVDTTELAASVNDKERTLRRFSRLNQINNI